MKKQLISPYLVLCLVFSGCGSQSSRDTYPSGQNLSPHNLEFTLNDNLEPVTTPASAFEAELERLREQGSADVAELHRLTVERNNTRAFENRPEADRLDFRNMQTTFLENGQIQATFDVVYFVEGEERTERVEFISPETIIGDEFSFRATQAFSLREIVLKGACIDGFQTCNHLVLEPAYYLDDMKVGRHFVAYRPSEELVRLRVEETRLELEEADDVQSNEINLTPGAVQEQETRTVQPPEDEDFEASSEPERRQVVRPQARPEGLGQALEAPATEVEEEEVVALDSTPPEVMTASPEALSGVAPSESGVENINLPDLNDSPPVQHPVPDAPPAPEVEEENFEAPPQPEARQEVIRPRPRPEGLGQTVEDAPEPRPEGLGQTVEAPATEVEEEEVVALDSTPPEVMTASPEALSGVAPSESGVENINLPRDHEEEGPPEQHTRPDMPPAPSLDAMDLDFEDPPRPEPRPVIRPQARPEGLGQTAEAPAPEDGEVSLEAADEAGEDTVQLVLSEEAEIEEAPDAESHDPEVSVSSGHYYLGSVDERDEDVGVFYNLNSGQAFPIHLQPTPVEDQLLSDVLNKSYNQSRGSYINGSLVNAEQLPREIEGAVVNPRRDSHQWGSGLSIDFIQYIASRYNRMESGTPFCINNISLEEGGNTPSHSSHENGLDIDISYPSSSNECTSSRNFLVPWSNLSDNDPGFLERNWEFLKFILVDDEVKNRVTIIFSDKNFMKSLCSWAQENNKEQAHIESVLDKLYHQGNHHHHYHIRMTCNQQNEGCTPQNSYTRSDNKVNPVSCQ